MLVDVADDGMCNLEEGGGDEEGVRCNRLVLVRAFSMKLSTDAKS